MARNHSKSSLNTEKIVILHLSIDPPPFLSLDLLKKKVERLLDREEPRRPSFFRAGEGMVTLAHKKSFEFYFYFFFFFSSFLDIFELF